MKAPHAVLATAVSLGLAAAHAQVTVFDAASATVTIPSVSVGATTYTNVRLRHQGSSVFVLESADALTHGAPGTARYDSASDRLDIPAVRVGADTYVDVTLQGDAQFVATHRERLDRPELPHLPQSCADLFTVHLQLMLDTPHRNLAHVRHAHVADEMARELHGLARRPFRLADVHEPNLAGEPEVAPLQPLDALEPDPARLDRLCLLHDPAPAAALIRQREYRLQG